MKVLVAHSFYTQSGGEDSVVESEIELLRQWGVEVIPFFRYNQDTARGSSMRSASRILWNSEVVSSLQTVCRKSAPDLIHLHNSFFGLSASFLVAARALRLPVVQTIHNFRSACIQAMFLRDGRVCEDCVSKGPLQGVLNRCYRGSVLSSLIATGFQLQNSRLRAGRDAPVSKYIALNNFCRQKLIDIGFAPESIEIKPNFVHDSGRRSKNAAHFLFVGRLSEEKGILQLLDAAAECAVKVRVIGDGPLFGAVAAHPNAEVVGKLAAEQVLLEMCDAKALVVPSIWYENFPRVVVEAYSVGLPVVARKIGALQEVVADGDTGLLFDDQSGRTLASALLRLVNSDCLRASLAAQARTTFEENYSATVNGRVLMEIYNRLVEQGPHREP